MNLAQTFLIWIGLGMIVAAALGAFINWYIGANIMSIPQGMLGLVLFIVGVLWMRMESKG